MTDAPAALTRSVADDSAALADVLREVRELRALRRRVAVLETHVGQLMRRRENPDARLPDLLRMIYAFSRDRPWSASELLDDARRAAPYLWMLLDQITGQNVGAA